MELDRIMTISTKHISQETFSLLLKGTKEWSVERFVAIYEKICPLGFMGFLVHIPEDYSSERKAGGYNNVPEDLHECIMLAVKHKCVWLCLDLDGSVTDELKIY